MTVFKVLGPAQLLVEIETEEFIFWQYLEA